MAERLTLPYNPFHQIPNEVIAKIFSEGTKMWQESNYFPNKPKLPFPDLVSAVCKHWRSLAHDTPELWAHIRPPTRDGCISWMSNWFERSKSIPVAVTLDDRVWDTTKNNLAAMSDIPFSEILTFMEGFAHRLHRLDIRLQYIALDCVSQVLSKTTELQQLSLYQPSRISLPPPTFVVVSFGAGEWGTLFQQMGNLKRLRVSGVFLPLATQLTCLEIADLNLPYSEIRTLFGAGCRLRYLILPRLFPVIGVSPGGSDSPIRVESLYSIAVNTRPHMSTSVPRGPYLFSFLYMPNLTHLELECDCSLSTMFGKSLPDTKIDTLKIRTYLPLSRENESDADVALLRSLSALRRLELVRLIGASAKILLDRISGAGHVGLSSKPSIGSKMASFKSGSARNSTKASVPPMDEAVWPKLRSILLETSIAEDVVSLISFIQRHKGVTSVELSTLAMRHLCFLRRKENTITSTPPAILSGRGYPFEAKEDEGTNDVEEWLSRLVDLKLMNRNRSSLLSTDEDDLLSQLP